jgi:hypothetical protein
MTPENATRTFPFTVRPGHLETLESYTRRTFEANGEPESLQRELMKHASSTSWQSVLSAKVGRNLDWLCAPSTVGLHEECAPCAASLSERWACLLCTHGERVQQHPHLDDFLCEQHHRWVGPGTDADAQCRVSTAQVAAHRKMRTLRRRGRLDLPLLLETLDALTRDLQRDAHDVFHAAVRVVAWATRRDTLRRLFDPAQPYAANFAWTSETLAAIAGQATPETARALWLRMWPAHIALQTAFRGYATYDTAHVHDFTLPEGIARWYPHPATLQSARDYLACAGLDQASAVARRSDEPTVANPVSRRTHCTKGHSYLEVLTSNTAGQTPCPRCTRAHVEVGVNDLASVAPSLACELHPTLNGELRADCIAGGSSKKVWWLCPHFHPYEATPANRTLNDSGCSVCLGRVIIVGVNDLWTTHPPLAAELHPSSRSSKRAHQLTSTDTIVRDWLCADGHEFRASVAQRVAGKKPCPDCERKRTRASRRNLAVTHPEISSTWRPELNEGREPHDYTKGSSLEVVWWCEEGSHPFTMRIEPRTRGCGCPYCASRLILPGFNDFATRHPQLAADWHRYLNRKNADEVMPGSNDEHHWRCKNGHVLRRSIPHRVASGGCVECPWHERVGNRRRAANAA